jgi:hypothetical protein
MSQALAAMLLMNDNLQTGGHCLGRWKNQRRWNMLYHVHITTVTEGREEEALRLLKRLADHSNKINPKAVVEIVRHVDGPANELIWLGKLESLADHEEGGKVFQSDPQTQAMMKEGEELFTNGENRIYEVL